jgi:hypothetical protein
MPSDSVKVQAEDERLHPPAKHPLWSESFYLNFSDSDGGLGGFTRVALHPARNESEGLLCIYLRGGAIGIVLVNDALQQPRAEVVRAGGLEHECIAPLEHWRIRYDGEMRVFDDPALVARALEPNPPAGKSRHVKMDLKVTGLHPPFFYPDYRKVNAPPPCREHGPAGWSMAWKRKLIRAMRRPREILSALQMRSGRHYEQSMTVQGTVTIGGETEAFIGTGHRDHSWGPRDWGASHRWRWLTGQIEGLAFNAMYLTIAGTHVTNGYVCHGGRCSRVDELGLDSSFDGAGLAGRALCLELKAGSERFLITGETFFSVPLPIAGPGYSIMYTISRTQWRCGDRIGYGVAEFLERLEP